MDNPAANSSLLYGAYSGSLPIVRDAIAEGADVECTEQGTFMTALHLAVGRSHLEIVKFLVEKVGAQIRPDGFGRWPTVIAAQCGASDELCDYIVAREAALTESIGLS